MCIKKDFNMSLVPIVIEESPKGERSFDIYSRLLRDRIVMVTGPIETAMANTIVAQLLFLESENPNADISLYINSPGGDVSAGWAIMDTMQYIKPNVSTIGMGLVASMASVLLAAGEKGKRFVLPNTQIMIHQPSSGTEGKVTDMEIYLKEVQYTKKAMIKQMMEFTGRKEKEVFDAMERDNWMQADEAKKFGLIDGVLTRK
jgi:ATP-dependent Clp protease protease subunit